ncbi:hypothetical protein TcasGA2_TC014508 [Tribolium castaneum]|uniref:Uncharacterized protein n=1 Tax=Tribolium castaneum TaxID=7070 RepID=D6WP68_TRICA|nr:hypothetical protein TcasGA2_TC014508 [Tribolium castaneum]
MRIIKSLENLLRGMINVVNELISLALFVLSAPRLYHSENALFLWRHLHYPEPLFAPKGFDRRIIEIVDNLQFHRRCCLTARNFIVSLLLALQNCFGGLWKSASSEQEYLWTEAPEPESRRLWKVLIKHLSYKVVKLARYNLQKRGLVPACISGHSSLLIRFDGGSLTILPFFFSVFLLAQVDVNACLGCRSVIHDSETHPTVAKIAG